MQTVRKLVLTVFACSAVVLGLSSSAHAISSVGPDPADFGAAAGDVFGYVLIRDPNATILSVDVPLYYTNNTTNKVVTITEPDLCWDTNPNPYPYMTAPSGNNYRDFDINNSFAYNERTSVFSAPGAANVYGVKSSSPTCYRNTKTMTIPASSLQLDANTGLYKVVFTASVWGTKGQQNRFRLSVGAGGYVGYSSSASADSYGVARQYPYSGYRRYNIPFAPPCSVQTAQTNQTIRLYDDDNFTQSIQGTNPFEIRVAEYNAVGTFLRYVPFTSWASTMAPVNSTTLRPNSGNSQTTWARFTAQPYRKYRLVVDSVFYINVLQFQLPYDSINMVVNCVEWRATSASTVPSSTAQPGQSVTFTHTVTNNGPEPASIGWRAEQTSPSLSQIGIGGATAYTNGQQKTVNQSTITIPNGTPAGTRYCQRVGINPFESTDTDPAYTYSAEACVVVANKPRLSVVGGDAASGGNFVCGSTTGGFKGAGNLPGSFGEYGLIVAPGSIVGFSSAGTITTPGSRSLAFANNPIANPLGNYDASRCVKNLEPKLRNGVAFSNYGGGALPSAGNYLSAASLTINGATVSGGPRLIISDGDITITGNLTYTGGPYARYADVPSLVVIADNIRFAAGVTQVDGLFIARNNITTCSEAGASTTVVKSAVGIAQLRAGGACRNSRIVVNGAVIANGELVPARSFGGDAATTLPAEAVIFRPEVYLAPFERGTSYRALKTDSETELPPRN